MLGAYIINRSIPKLATPAFRFGKRAPELHARPCPTDPALGLAAQIPETPKPLIIEEYTLN